MYLRFWYLLPIQRITKGRVSLSNLLKEHVKHLFHQTKEQYVTIIPVFEDYINIRLVYYDMDNYEQSLEY